MKPQIGPLSHRFIAQLRFHCEALGSSLRCRLVNVHFLYPVVLVNSEWFNEHCLFINTELAADSTVTHA